MQIMSRAEPQLNIRGPGARGRMSRLTPDPPAKPARLCGTLRPSFENKGEGLTLAIRPLFLDGLQVF
ncbi:hypothetical protein NQZ68_019770 [Dissostichus eleginoides]|nr:hypothetical protein NQZ68_019770 [Dissostichus eleginoides]